MRTFKESADDTTATISTATRIEEVALELFRDKGYTAASIRDITAGSGVAISTLFHHYSNKMAILERLMYRAINDLQANLNAAVAGKTDPTERLSACVRVIIVDHCRRASLSFVAEKEVHHLPPEVGGDIRRRRLQVRDQILSAIVDGVNAGEFTSSDPKTAALAIITMCTAVSTWYRAGGEHSPEELAQLFVDYALNIVRKV